MHKYNIKMYFFFVLSLFAYFKRNNYITSFELAV